MSLGLHLLVVLDSDLRNEIKVRSAIRFLSNKATGSDSQRLGAMRAVEAAWRGEGGGGGSKFPSHKTTTTTENLPFVENVVVN